MNLRTIKRRLLDRLREWPASLMRFNRRFRKSRLKAGRYQPRLDHTFAPGQWHRWYQANRKRQRQLSALKRTGRFIHPSLTGLPREAVR